MPLMAAKNLLMCHLIFSSAEEAAAQLERWVEKETFYDDELMHLRISLQEAIIRGVPTPA